MLSNLGNISTKYEQFENFRMDKLIIKNIYGRFIKNNLIFFCLQNATELYQNKWEVCPATSEGC